MALSKNDILSVLEKITDPQTNLSIVAAGRVSAIVLRESSIGFVLAVPVGHEEKYLQVQKSCEVILQNAFPDMRVTIVLTNAEESSAAHASSSNASEVDQIMKRGKRKGEQRPEGVARVIMVAAGKGGVGKSMLTAGLALAAQAQGMRSAILDADIFGPSIPKMFGVSVQPEVRNQKMIPPEVFGVQLNSMGLLLPEKTSTVWRGAMLAKALNQLLFTTAWTNRDVLFVDVPPGTGDVSLSLSEQCKIDGCVLVSTPQGLALLDVQKAADMCRKLEVPLWGVVENMSYIEHGDTRFCLFGEGNVENFALAESLPFLGRIPLVPELAKAADSGLIAASDITKYTAEIFQKISKNFSSKKI